MTPQEIFEKAYISVVKQGCPSLKHSTTVATAMICAYRGDGGTACGVGHLIDDETAREWDMIGAIDDVIAQLEDHLPYWVISNARLLQQIQYAHDFAEAEERTGSPENFTQLFKDKMSLVANQFTLTVPDIPNT